MDKSQSMNELAVKFLKSLGKRKPTQKHVELAEKLLMTTTIPEQLYFDGQLTAQEANCLLLAAKGLTTNEMASILHIKSSTVETHRRKILEKLSSSNLTQAVFQGIRLGHLRGKQE